MIISLDNNITLCDRSSVPENYSTFDESCEFKTSEIFIYWITEVSRFLETIDSNKSRPDGQRLLIIIDDDNVDNLYAFIAVYNIVNAKQRKDITVRNLNQLYNKNIHLSVKHKKFIDKLQTLILSRNVQKTPSNYSNSSNSSNSSNKNRNHGNNGGSNLISCISTSPHQGQRKSVTFW